MKIEKFGKIYEKEGGKLVIDGFSLVGNGEPATVENVLTAVIERLNDEIDKSKKQ